MVRVAMTPFLENVRDYEACTNGDFVSVADKDEQIKGFAKLSPTFPKSNFILSLNKVTYVPKILLKLVPCNILCGMYLVFKERL